MVQEVRGIWSFDVMLPIKYGYFAKKSKPQNMQLHENRVGKPTEQFIFLDTEP